VGCRSLVLVLLAAAGCGDNTPGDDRQGGANTVDDRTESAFTHATPGLSADDLAEHENGRGPFYFKWEPPQVGPLLSNNQCAGCHGSNGRGLSQIGPEMMFSQALVRCSAPAGTPGDPGGPIPVPGFGTQLQDHATDGLPEVVIELTWQEHVEMFGDGSTVSMRSPRLDIHTPNGGTLPNGTMYSYRQAPPVIGLGLLDAIEPDAITALADPDDLDGDGIRGHVNMVWNPETQTTELGRFGHKANVSSLRVQSAAAFANDMGLTNKLEPDPAGNQDVSDAQLEQTAFFVRTLAVPAAASRNIDARTGRDRFDAFGCTSCHVPTLVTGESPVALLAHQTIHPYTDLLLHDMGDLLTDARHDFLADGVDWRTPPLWGIGLAQIVLPGATFLHDGRARTLVEAIMWHGGEAAAAKDAFRTAPKEDRDALIAFLNTL